MTNFRLSIDKTYVRVTPDNIITNKVKLNKQDLLDVIRELTICVTEIERDTDVVSCNTCKHDQPNGKSCIMFIKGKCSNPKYSHKYMGAEWAPKEKP